jgi:hypothetical protein
MIDLRYFGMALIAVFLALAIGLMTGSALGGPDKRDAAYEGLRNQFELLREENQRVRDEGDLARRRLQSRDQALRDLSPRLIQNRLDGTPVAVLICGGADERGYWGELENAFRLSGAGVGPVARIPDDLKPLSAEVRARFVREAHLGRRGDGESRPEPDADPVVLLISGLAAGAPETALRELAGETGIELRGAPSGPVRRLLLVTAAEDPARALRLRGGDLPELRIVDTALAARLIVVAAEAEGAANSVVDLLGRRGCSTVDNVDTAPGQLSTILALAGTEGRFGSKPGASRAVALPPE